jgi:prepilin-type N-terminal cleavage/methylation domain-containing protein/prepilin-type processing-associated H-X9-DG protein
MIKSIYTNRGFTLVELLVVIAIIAILAAIMFPVFAKARDKARQASCQNNLKSIGAAMLMYAQDYEEMFPGAGSSGGNNSWDAAVQPYIRSTKIFKCPSHSLDESTNSYGANQLLLGVAAPRIINPTAAVLLFDANTQKSVRLIGNGMAFSSFRMAAPLYHDDNTFALTHGDGDNICFADGHVKWYRTRALANAAPINEHSWNDISFLPSNQ